MKISGPTFRPYMKAILQLSNSKQIALTALIYTEIISSIIHRSCLPRRYHMPTQVSFAVTNVDQFYSHKYTKPIEILPFGKKQSFFAYHQIREDLLLGKDFLSLIAPFTFHSKGFVYISILLTTSLISL